jgi:hypothetical protein
MILVALISLIAGQGLIGPTPGVQIQDEGTSQGQVVKLNFTGSAVSCSRSGSTGTCNVTAGGGGGNWGSTTVTFGSGGLSTYDSATKTVTGQAWVGASSTITVWVQCDGVGNTVETCRLLSPVCYVSGLVAGAGFDVVCTTPMHAHGNFTVGFTGQ